MRIKVPASAHLPRSLSPPHGPHPQRPVVESTHRGCRQGGGRTGGGREDHGQGGRLDSYHQLLQARQAARLMLTLELLFVRHSRGVRGVHVVILCRNMPRGPVHEVHESCGKMKHSVADVADGCDG